MRRTEPRSRSPRRQHWRRHGGCTESAAIGVPPRRRRLHRSPNQNDAGSSPTTAPVDASARVNRSSGVDSDRPS
jgi:hypothetical protein